MGLHRWDMSVSSNPSPEECLERQNVLYCLYCLDKSVCWSYGWLPSLVASELSTGISPSTTRPSDEVAAFLSSKFGLAQIEEQLYISLYSGNATIRSVDGLSKTVIKSFHQMLQDWRTTHNMNDEGVEDGSDSTFAFCSRIELVICFLSTRMRLMWPVVEHPEACNLLLEDARSSLSFLQRLWNATSEQGHYASFAR
jgi:hypothetical protein